MYESIPATHLNIRLTGDVRGVFFKRAARHKARRLGLTGTIHEEDDGTVHIEIEGPKSVLQEFLDWCRRGPHLFAHVDSVHVEEGANKNFSGFEILPEDGDNS